jgi:hypothetical protein
MEVLVVLVEAVEVVVARILAALVHQAKALLEELEHAVVAQTALLAVVVVLPV